MQTQSFNNKDFFYFKKPKIKNLKSILLYNNMTKPIKKKTKKIKKRGFEDKNGNILENKKNKP